MTNSKTSPIVVGIGASAGGLEALQQFFKHMPGNLGLVYVVVQHLSPDYKSMMDELLSRHTKMSIKIVKDGDKLMPNTIYLIPPRQNLRLYKNTLFLNKQDPSKGLHLPIDIFLKSLAEEKGQSAIGVILSGTGSDGTKGTRAIKEKDGLIMVQDEKSAKFNGMPLSAISTGLVDYILPPEKMGPEIQSFLEHPLVKKPNQKKEAEKEEMDTLSKVILLLRDYSGIDFAFYKENTIHRRLERRISVNRYSSIEEYLEFLSESDKEKEILYREFLIGVTHFFRDKEAFKSLHEKALPNLFRKDKRFIRVWTTGCSTGEEAYSITILLMEAAEHNNFKGEVKVFASDIDRNSIEIASRGFYPDSIVSDVEPHLLQKYFHKTENGYRINEGVRNNIVFATHNVLKDPPFSKLDLMVCRNLFIYLKPEIQSNLLSRFYYSLNPEGYLFMGSSETLGGMSDAFEIIDTKNKIYKYKSGFVPPAIDNLSLSTKAKKSLPGTGTYRRKRNNGTNIEKLFEALVNDLVPPSIIVDSNLSIINIINNINPFAEIQTGNDTNDLFSILPKDLGLFVNNVIRQLKSSNESSVTRIITGIRNLEKNTVQLKARKLYQGDLTFYVISFEFVDYEKPDAGKGKYKNIDLTEEQVDRVTDLEQELKDTKENLAATVEELESANEELQSSNEELIASNEELQSTNEELQSVNEELHTVNSEHQEKIGELSRLNNDINNLVKNTEIAAIYLDSSLRIRKITPHVSKVTHIIDNDIGRPISHITVMNNYSEIAKDVQQVQDSLQQIDKEIQDDKGNSFFVRLRPYRMENNSVEGILIAIVDISELKKLEAEKSVASERLTASLRFGNMAWWEWDIKSGNVKYDDRKATMLGYQPDEFPDNVYEICKLIHPEDYESTMNEMKKVLSGKTNKWDATYRMKNKDGSYTWYRDYGAIKQTGTNGKPERMIGMVVDVTNFQDMASELKKNEELLELIMNSTPVSTVMVDSEGHLTYANKKAEKVFNVSREQLLKRSYNASEWEITSVDGKKLKTKELPFSIIKKTKMPISGFQHYIKVPGNKKVLLTIDGAPVISDKNQFDGAVFAIKSESK